MATQSTATSSEGKNPVTKSPRQKITEEVLPKVNPDVPLRPATNNDPNKPVDAKALNEVAAANSNHGIQRPPGTPERLGQQGNHGTHGSGCRGPEQSGLCGSTTCQLPEAHGPGTHCGG